jgi:tRNA A-37 threonylcarbamoyl transferase component Bud32
MDTLVEGLPVKEQRLGEVIAAYLEAIDAGWAPPREEVLSSYPELSADLSAFFQCQDEISRLALPSPSPPAAFTPESTGRRAETFPGQSAFETPTAALPPLLPAANLGEGLHVLGDYELLSEIRRGGMGVVYKARQRSLNRVVALKTMRPEAWTSPAEAQRFRNEAEQAANLDHPHIVPIYEVGESGGLLYFSMKLFEGGSLADHLARYRVDAHAAVRLLAQVARAVHHAHQRGLLHRDLKPANILLDKEGQPHVADFGLAKRLRSAECGERSTGGEEPDVPSSPSGTPPSALRSPPFDLTEAGAVVGTPGYMSPEQAAGQKTLTTAADVYGLGAVLYKLLTGRPPFDGSSMDETLRRVREEEPTPPRVLDPRVDVRLEAVCLTCLSKDPGQRYRSAEALAEDLERWLAGEPPLAWPQPWRLRAWRAVRRHLAVSAAVAVCAVVVAVLVLAYYYDPDRPLYAAQGRLADGKAVTLIGPLGPPAWSRWTTGGEATTRTTRPNEPFALATLAAGHLKLLPDPQVTAYRFRAEVRHDEAVNVGEAGIYFGFSTGPTDNGVVHFWCQLAFADRGRNARMHWPRGQELKGLPNLSRLSLSVHRRLEPSGAYRVIPSPVFLTFPPGPEDLPPPWRKLAVEVTPKKVRVWWEGQLVPDGEISVDRLAAHVNNTYRLIGKGQPGPTFAFAPRGALGLFVNRGKASFRNVAVEPLR